MGVKNYNPTSAGRRFQTGYDFEEITKAEPERSLLAPLRKRGGPQRSRRHDVAPRGGGHKRRYRLIDFRRGKDGIAGTVASIEYDPNRTARIALVNYADARSATSWHRRTSAWEAAFEAVRVRTFSRVARCRSVSSLSARRCTRRTQARRRRKLVRSAGASAQLVREGGAYALLRLPSGELRNVRRECRATVGAVGNAQHENIAVGKAGRNRWKGIVLTFVVSR